MDSYRFCKVCKLSKESTDFILNQEDCYKCVYAQKLKQVKIVKKDKICKMCAKPLPNERWTYCTVKCAKEAKLKNRHWTHTFRKDTKDWKKRFIF